MVDDWVCAATDQLERLAGERHYGKMRATIVALVGARLAGESDETVWSPRRPETCARAVYQSHWKQHALFADVLTQVERIARAHVDGRALRAKQEAAEKLALASLDAVARLVTLLDSIDESIVLRASTAVLDRAGIETASKSTVAGNMGVQIYLPDNGRDGGGDAD